MKKGFPRPVVFVDNTSTNTYVGDDPNDYGSWGPEWDNRYYPYPYTAEDNFIASLSNPRAYECVKHKLCFVCGEYVEGDLVGLLLDNRAWINRETGPFHFKCLHLALVTCPYLALTDKSEPACGLWSDLQDLILKTFENPYD